MKRYLLFVIAIFLSSLTCFAQLNKFEGTWIHKWVLMFEDMYGNRRPHADCWSFFRFDVSDKDIHIRHKQWAKFFETGEEKTSYYTINPTLTL